MMGRQEKQSELWVEPVNLARRIGEDHPLRKLNRVLKLDFVREEVAGFYGVKGQVSVDPVVLMKMMLLLFWDDVKSERELMRVIPLRIDYLWFLGYGLEDEIPNHSVLSKARRRWGQEVFERLFSKTVQQCFDAGLIDGSKLHMDSSLVRADASLNSVVQVTLAKLESEEEASDGQDGPCGPVNRQHQSTTDPEATVVRHGAGKSLPSYKNHRALDDKAGVITATITTTGVRNEGQELPALLQQHRQRIPLKPKAVVADSKYGTTTNFLELSHQGIRSHMADLRARLRNAREEGIYPADRFRYDPKSDSFRCPAKRKLRAHHFDATRGYWEYRTKPGTCDTCRLRSCCTRAKMGRTLKRYQGQELLDRARRQSHGPSARLDRKRRQWFQERNFGEAAVQHGFKRARWRGLVRQSIQDYLIAVLQNLKILLRKGSWTASQLFNSLKHLLNSCQTLINSICSTFNPTIQIKPGSPCVA